MRSKANSLRCHLPFIFILTLILFPASTFSATIRVPTDQPTIQAGIDAASTGDVVLVADGTYTGSGNKDLDFGGKAITVQSESGPVNTIIDCEGDGRGFNFQSGEGQDSVVSGFTITNGKGGHGGGILCYDSSPTVTNCIIKGNSTQYTSGDYYGGGIYCSAMYSWKTIYPVITNCTIVGNQSGRRGGGIYFFGANATIANCTITENSTGNDFDASGGGISSSFSSLTITNSIIWGNSPTEGAGGSVTYSNIKGGWPGEGNIDVNPAFVDPANGDYHLKDFSPCIGTGTSVAAPDTDIESNPRPNPAGSNPDMGAYENSRGIRAMPPLNIFAVEVGNRWNYEGTRQGNPYTVEREVIRLDQTTFPVDTYVHEIRENGILQPSEWYETTSNELRLWASGGYQFSAGLLTAWYPMQVDDHRESSANVVGFPGVSVSLTVDVISKGSLALTFDTFEAYELHYQLQTSEPGGTVTETFRRWVVPYIGVVKDQRGDSLVELTSFAIGGGTITQDTDADNDSLKDYQELFLYDTDWLDVDTDDDGMTDGWEATYGFDPLDDQDANEDADQDGFTNLEEYIKGTDPTDPNSHPSRAMPGIPLLLLDD